MAFSANLGFLFTELSLIEGVHAAHAAGFGAIECHFPYATDPRDFKAALEKLPDDQREAIILVGASGFAYEEAAVICGCAVGTIKSRVNRARTRLADLLKISGDADFGPDAHSLAVTSRTFARM